MIRGLWALRAGCLVPLVNLFWAPVFVIELANVEERLSWLRRPIVVWWIVWFLSTAVSIFSIATSFTQDLPQGIADNTVATIIAYLFAAALLLAMKVFLGFERQPVERPSKRWVMVRDDGANTAPSAEKQPEPEPEQGRSVGVKGRTRQHSRMNSGDGTLGHPFVVAHRGASADRPEHPRGL